MKKMVLGYLVLKKQCNGLTRRRALLQSLLDQKHNMKSMIGIHTNA